MRSGTVAIVLAAALSAPAVLAQSLTPRVLYLAPECDGLASLADALNEHKSLLVRAQPSLLPINAADLRELPGILDGHKHDDLLLLYAGHGLWDSDGRSALCFRHDRIVVEKMLNDMEASADHGVTLVLDSCYGSRVDVQLSRRPTAVISGSQDQLWADSDFPRAVAAALQDSHLDENCDGLTTDQELFDGILGQLKLMPTSLARMYEAQPRLRRQQQRPVLLPVPSRCDRASQVLDEVERLVSAMAAIFTPQTAEFVEDLQRQLGLARGTSAELPRGTRDYYCLRPHTAITSSELQGVQDGLKKGGLVPLPSLACEPATARRLASFALASSIYQASINAGWVEITRLGPSNWLVLSERLDRANLQERIGHAVQRRVPVMQP